MWPCAVYHQEDLPLGFSGFVVMMPFVAAEGGSARGHARAWTSGVLAGEKRDKT